MAPIKLPWRAMALVSVLALAACEPGASLSGVGLPSSTGDSAQAETSTMAESGPVLDLSVERLVAMGGPANEDGTLGSGCDVDGLDALADGDWFGFVVQASPQTVTVDIACVYGPDTEQFAAYSDTSDSRSSGYVVVNDVVGELEIRIAPGAQAFLAIDGWEPRPASELAAAQAQAPSDGSRGVWMRVQDDRVVAVVQPYSRGAASG